MENPKPEVDIAISFAGEDRAYVDELSNAIKNRGLKVFYDKYEEANLWGKDLYSHLSKVYKDDAKYCLIVVSSAYAIKQWTNHERRAAQARAFSENREYILPLRLDDTQIEGILETTGYLDARSKNIDEIVDLIYRKVLTFNKENGITNEIVKFEEVCALAGVGKDTTVIKDKDTIITCPACSTEQFLSESPISIIDGDTAYNCKHGCLPILIVGKPGVDSWQGRGYRFGNYVIRNSSPIRIKVVDSNFLELAASPASLMKKRPE